MQLRNENVATPTWLERTCLVLRGLPGVGKSTLAARLPRHRYFSADLFHTVGGEYQFKKENQPLAHRTCLKSFVDFVTSRPASNSLLVVDNTNVSEWEYAPYVRLAEAYDFVPVVVLLVDAVDACANRNVHGVPREVVDQMYARLQPTAAVFPRLLATADEPFDSFFKSLEVVTCESRRRLHATAIRI